MSGSYRKLNYSLRPAKSVERKMILEAIRCLAPFAVIQSYRYVGFGSPYFSDFTLFHNQLGLTQMVSIEADVKSSDRFEHNKPFKCIDMLYETSNKALPKLDLNPRSIYWLDYDGRLDLSVLTDVQTLVSKASVGSLLLFTVNCDAKPDGERVEHLKRKVGDRHVPAGLTEEALIGWDTARVCRDIIFNKIQETLVSRNVGSPKMCYKQLFNFHYADNAQMLCTGGILYDDGQTGLLAACQFDRLEFFRDGTDEYQIEIPKLTRLELRYLNARLPGEIHDEDCRGIPKPHIHNYTKLYRYFPVFSEVDI